VFVHISAVERAGLSSPPEGAARRANEEVRSHFVIENDRSTLDFLSYGPHQQYAYQNSIVFG
jgi:hypothetical protein